VCDPLAPFLRLPVSKLPSFAVAVWGALSWLVHFTVSPLVTVTVAGEKAKFLIVTALAPAAWAVGFTTAATSLVFTTCSSAGPGAREVTGCTAAGSDVVWAGGGAGAAGAASGVVAVAGWAGGSSAAHRRAGVARAAARK
jgi:hypothetical protein